MQTHKRADETGIYTYNNLKRSFTATCVCLGSFALTQPSKGQLDRWRGNGKSGGDRDRVSVCRMRVQERDGKKRKYEEL